MPYCGCEGGRVSGGIGGGRPEHYSQPIDYKERFEEETVSDRAPSFEPIEDDSNFERSLETIDNIMIHEKEFVVLDDEGFQSSEEVNNEKNKFLSFILLLLSFLLFDS